MAETTDLASTIDLHDPGSEMAMETDAVQTPNHVDAFSSSDTASISTDKLQLGDSAVAETPLEPEAEAAPPTSNEAVLPDSPKTTDPIEQIEQRPVQSAEAPESNAEATTDRLDDAIMPMEISQPEDLQNAPSISSSSNPQMTKTSVLPVHQELQPSNTSDLVDTIQRIFEEDDIVRENGVVLLDAPHLIPKPGDIVLPPPSYTFEATSQRVMTPAKVKGKGIVVIKHEEASLKNRNPKFPPPSVLSPQEMEGFFKKHVELHQNQNRYPYFNIDISDRSVRPQGSFELTCGSPMDKLSYIAGMNTPYGYYSRGISHFGAHVEDWHCASYNVHFAGATKLWVAVKPSSQKLLEQKIREHFPDSGTCVQFVRHQAINIAPSTLRNWGVEHFFVPQNPGQIVAVSGYTYHWGLNTGHNYAEAINFCLERDWQAAEDFRMCYPGCGINHESLPLPKPVYEEGTMEEKKARSFERDAIARKAWQESVEKFEQDLAQKLEKKPRTSMPRRKSESTRQLRRSIDSAMPCDTPEAMASQSRLDKDDEMRDRMAVSTASQRLNDRGHKRRSTLTRVPYRDAESSAGSTDEDDQPPVRRSRPMASAHSRHNSGHNLLMSSQQPDMGAILSEMKLMKAFMIEQKQASAKNEETLRMQLHYQKRSADILSKQLEEQTRQRQESERQRDVSQKMLSVLLEMNHRMMTTAQAIETRSMQSGSQAPSNAPSEMNAPSLASSNSGSHSAQHCHRQFTAMSNRPPQYPKHHASTIHVAQRRDRADLTTNQSQQHREQAMPDSTIQAMLHSLGDPETESIRSMPVSLTRDATRDNGSEAFDHSPPTPGMKSLQSTPQLDGDDDAISTNSSLSEAEMDESTILVRPKDRPKDKPQPSTVTETDNEAPVSSPESQASDSDYKITVKPKKKSTPKSRPVSTAEGGDGSTPLVKVCKACSKRRMTATCDGARPKCSTCVDNSRQCEYASRVYRRFNPMPSTKRSASTPDAGIEVATKKAKTSQDSVTASSTSRVTPELEMNSADEEADASGPLRGTRELMGLFPTSKSDLFGAPMGPRRAASRPLQG